jgi:FdhD protein
MSDNRHSESNRRTGIFHGNEENISSPLYVPMKCLEITDKNKQYSDVDVIVEKKFDLFVNDVHVTTIFASPMELKELALGFLVCEGFVAPGSQKGPIRITSEAIFCEIDIDTEELAALTHQQRCGTTSYRRDTARHIASDMRFSKDAILNAVEQLKEKGKAWHRTGGAHTSMICDNKGEVLFFCEDVGRACSVDKVVGKALLSGMDLSQCALVTTGRLASTMVSKAVNAGFPLIASKGATVREAIELANEAGITLVAFARKPNMHVYSMEQRIVFE